MHIRRSRISLKAAVSSRVKTFGLTSQPKTSQVFRTPVLYKANNNIVQYHVENIDQSKLNQLSIYELRNLARRVGIPRPTTMLRIDLIENIIRQTQTDDFTFEENQAATKRGRPPRVKDVSIANILVEPKTQPGGIEEILGYSVRAENSRQTEMQDAYGFLYIVQKGTGILITQTMNTFQVPLRLITEHKLKTGDYIKTRAKDVWVEQVTDINRTNLDESKSIRPHKPQKINCMEFKLGQRVIVTSPTKLDFVEYIATSNKHLNSLYTVALLVDESEDSVDFLTNHKINEVYLAQVKFDKKTRLLLALSALLVAKQHASTGKDVVLFIDSLNKLFRMYHSDHTQMNSNAITDLKSFFMEARQVTDGGSLTIISCMREGSTELEKLVLDDFIDMANLLHTHS